MNKYIDVCTFIDRYVFVYLCTCMYVCMYEPYVCICICMLWRTSALASSVCGRCMFISSPSKSALYGVQAHSKTAYVNVCMYYVCMYVCMYLKKPLNRNVLHGNTLTLCAMIDILCRDGCRLNSTYVCMYVCMYVQYVCMYEVLRNVCNAYHVIVYHVSLYNIPHTQVHRRPLFVRIQ